MGQDLGPRLTKSRRESPSWNSFGCSISEDVILQAAQALVDTGLKNLGYECALALFALAAQTL